MTECVRDAAPYENANVGAAIGRPRGRQYEFASGFGEYGHFTARTSDARPYNIWNEIDNYSTIR